MRRSDSNHVIHQILTDEEIAAVSLSEHRSAVEPAKATKEIMKELKKIQKQNLITHCLLESTIAITLVWQSSEVSLILSIKDVLRNPLKSLPRIIGKLFRETPAGNKINDAAGNFVSSSFPGFKISHLPRLGLSGSDISDEEDELS